MNHLFNVTGADRLILWHMDHDRIRKTWVNNTTWIFVSGSAYDLEFLSRQLDLVNWVRYSWDAQSDIYGLLKGIRIDLRPSRIKMMIEAIETIGYGRKFMVYNGDINPSLRYLSENNLTLFPIESLMSADLVPEIVTIDGKMSRNGLKSIAMDGKNLDPSRRESYGEIEERIRESSIVVYGNFGKQSESILRKVGDFGSGKFQPHVIPGSSFESYGQVHYNCNRISIPGKICIESSSFMFSEAGLNGLVELSRISSMPLETASLITPGTAVSALEVSYALRKGVLVPLYKNDHEGEKTIREMLATDRGGLVLQPDPGLYEDVHEVDFSSMYPSIIVRHNLSPETLSRDRGMQIPGTPYRVNKAKRGFLSEALQGLLERRLFYKSVKHLNRIYARRDIALKWMLLTSFGYTGYKNAKFGKIEVHEAITATGRWALTRAMRLAESMGFSVIHGIVDSLWITGNGDVNQLLSKILEETSIDIVVDGHYSWILFLPSRSGMGSLNRYIGLRTDGSFKVRGLDARRHDVPEISKRFQHEAMELLKNCATKTAIAEKRREYYALKRRFSENIRSFPDEDFYLMVSPSQHMEDYAVRNMSRIVMSKWKSMGYEINPGEDVLVKVVNWKMRLVEPVDGPGGIDYGFYGKYLERAAEPFDYLMQCVTKSGSGNRPNKSLYLFSE